MLIFYLHGNILWFNFVNFGTNSRKNGMNNIKKVGCLKSNFPIYTFYNLITYNIYKISVKWIYHKIRIVVITNFDDRRFQKRNYRS